MFDMTCSSTVGVSMTTKLTYTGVNELPDYDVIPSLNCIGGMYKSERWPDTVSEIIQFLNLVAKKYGDNAKVSLIESYDGYPGYIKITKAA